MSDSNSMWPFQEISAEEGLDINEIFGTGTSSGTAAPEANPFQVPQQAVPAPETTMPHVEQPPTSPRSAPSGADPCAAAGGSDHSSRDDPRRRACTQQSAGSSFRGKDRGERKSQPF